MGIDINQLWLTGGSIVVTAIITFFTTKHNLKEYTNEKFEKLKDRIHEQELEMEKLRGRDENQQQIIEVFQRQILDQLPKFYAIIENSTKKKKK